MGNKAERHLGISKDPSRSKRRVLLSFKMGFWTVSLRDSGRPIVSLSVDLCHVRTFLDPEVRVFHFAALAGATQPVPSPVSCLGGSASALLPESSAERRACPSVCPWKH